jgi:hypothetical protein
MHQYRQVVVRMRHGGIDRALAPGLMGRRKVADTCAAATGYGGLEVSQPLPNKAENLARRVTRPQTVSQLQPFVAEVKAWYDQEFPRTAILQAPRHEHFSQSSYSAVRRHLPTLPPRDL